MPFPALRKVSFAELHVVIRKMLTRLLTFLSLGLLRRFFFMTYVSVCFVTWLVSRTGIKELHGVPSRLKGAQICQQDIPVCEQDARIPEV